MTADLMFSDLDGSMLCVWTWIMWWKHHDLASVYSAFHSGQFLSAHRTHLQISLEGFNNDKLCCVCHNQLPSFFLILQLYASLPFLSMMLCYVYLKQSVLLPKPVFPFIILLTASNWTFYLVVATVTLFVLLFETGIITVNLEGIC